MIDGMDSGCGAQSGRRLGAACRIARRVCAMHRSADSGLQLLARQASAEMAQILFPLFERVIVAPIHTARAAALDDLLAAARATGTPAMAAESVREALQLARERSAGGVAVVSGSVYLVGEARSTAAGAEKAAKRS